MDRVTELTRRLNNIIRIGTIAAVDPSHARARLRDGALLSAWRPWLELRAGTTRSWNPPTVGEQALLLAPGGDPADSIILTGIYQDAHSAPSTSPARTRTDNPDGARVEYDHAHSVLHVQTPGDITLHAGGDITLQASGNVTISGQRVDLNP